MSSSLLLLLLCALGCSSGRKASPPVEPAANASFTRHKTNICYSGAATDLDLLRQSRERKQEWKAKGVCKNVETLDVMQAMYHLSRPLSYNTTNKRSSQCQQLRTVANTTFCEDLLPPKEKCVVHSVFATSSCSSLGPMEFERYIMSLCRLELFVFHPGGTCVLPAPFSGPATKDFALHTRQIWERRGQYYCAYYRLLEEAMRSDATATVSLLKMQTLDTVDANVMDGVQFTMLADMHMHVPELVRRIRQLVVTLPFHRGSLVDHIGREAEHGINMYMASELLLPFRAAASRTLPLSAGRLAELRPTPLREMLEKVGIDAETQHFIVSLYLLEEGFDEESSTQRRAAAAQWRPLRGATEILDDLRIGALPLARFCRIPDQGQTQSEMLNWIKTQLRARCQPYNMWVHCDYSRDYSAFLPCPEDIVNVLALDYASKHRWCDFSSAHAAIETLAVAPAAAQAFNAHAAVAAPGRLKIAFFITVYTDAEFIQRLLSRIYDRQHIYLLHVDANDGERSFFRQLQSAVQSTFLGSSKHGNGDRPAANIQLCQEVKIVYGASTATILLSKAMAFFSREVRAYKWSYLIALTGSDYPLLPLAQIERILSHRLAAPGGGMPFVMAWSQASSDDVARLQELRPELYRDDPDVAFSLRVLQRERGYRLMGTTLHELRAGNLGAVYTCANTTGFYRLEARRSMNNTQWLFPKFSVRGDKGRASTDVSPAGKIPSLVDGDHRVWKKSDPATTAAYDAQSVDYIANSVEGRKYFHFFKNTLLGSEEHYYVTLLYNWPRTRAFVQTLAAQGVWNTWEMGTADPEAYSRMAKKRGFSRGSLKGQGGFKTHTNFLTEGEFAVLAGSSRRGVLFARKFSRHTGALLDALDAYVHDNVSTDAGKHWPGFLQ